MTIAGAITSELHPLYGLLMSQLSSSIYEWDEGDYERHMKAKMSELMKAGIPTQQKLW